MMLDIFTNVLPAVLSDALNSQGYAAAGSLGATVYWGLAKLQKKRLERLRDILTEEVGDGLKDIEDAAEQDELIAIIHRILRATLEGTAKTNLRLLARIIAGQKASGTLKADEFLYYADIIASLKHEEIVLLGVLDRTFANTFENEQEYIAAENLDKAQMSATDKQKVVIADLISCGAFEDEDTFWAVAEALTRTGLVVIRTVFKGRTLVRLTPLFNKLKKLASFENLFDEKDSEQS